MKPQSIVVGVALLAAYALGYAQTMPPGGAQDYEAMAKSMEKAQAEANKPGDERLTCDQLQQQLVAIAQDPAYLAYVQAAGIQAQKDMAQMQVPQSEIAAKTAATMAASMVPGAAMGQMTAKVSAKWDGPKLVITTKSDQGEQTQTWSLAGGVLTIDRTGGRGPSSTKYKKTT